MCACKQIWLFLIYHPEQCNYFPSVTRHRFGWEPGGGQQQYIMIEGMKFCLMFHPWRYVCPYSSWIMSVRQEVLCVCVCARRTNMNCEWGTLPILWHRLTQNKCCCETSCDIESCCFNPYFKLKVKTCFLAIVQQVFCNFYWFYLCYLCGVYWCMKIFSEIYLIEVGVLESYLSVSTALCSSCFKYSPMRLKA